MARIVHHWGNDKSLQFIVYQTYLNLSFIQRQADNVTDVVRSSCHYHTHTIDVTLPVWHCVIIPLVDLDL